MKWIFYVLSAVIIIASASFSKEKKTVVYIVRHAEKKAITSLQKDPELTEAGYQRAADLTERLKKEHFDAVFSTPYKRTISTIAALAQRSGVGVQEYSAEKELAERILKRYTGRKILIAGHSNTVMNIIRELGGKTPEEELQDDDYDYLFKMEIKNKKATLEISHFGQPHHVTDISNK